MARLTTSEFRRGQRRLNRIPNAPGSTVTHPAPAPAASRRSSYVAPRKRLGPQGGFGGPYLGLFGHQSEDYVTPGPLESLVHQIALDQLRKKYVTEEKNGQIYLTERASRRTPFEMSRQTETRQSPFVEHTLNARERKKENQTAARYAARQQEMMKPPKPSIAADPELRRLEGKDRQAHRISLGDIKNPDYLNPENPGVARRNRLAGRVTVRMGDVATRRYNKLWDKASKYYGGGADPPPLRTDAADAESYQVSGGGSAYAYVPWNKREVHPSPGFLKDLTRKNPQNKAKQYAKQAVLHEWRHTVQPDKNIGGTKVLGVEVPDPMGTAAREGDAELFARHLAHKLFGQRPIHNGYADFVMQLLMQKGKLSGGGGGGSTW